MMSRLSVSWERRRAALHPSGRLAALVLLAAGAPVIALGGITSAQWVNVAVAIFGVLALVVNLYLSSGAKPEVRKEPAQGLSEQPPETSLDEVQGYVKEMRRIQEHPGVVFRSGPTGRRAALERGPDVWEVMRVFGAVKVAEPELRGDDVIEATAESLGLPIAEVRVAISYHAAYRDEINGEIRAAEKAAEAIEDEGRLLA